jgi:Holliday junction resolvase RusA-like endonuclease
MIAKRQYLRKGLDNDLRELRLTGEPASKANSRRLVSIRGRPAFIKSKKAIDYSKNFEIQCPTYDTLYEEDLVIALKIYYKSKRPDLDESLILDLLQGKVYKNDRSIKLKYVEWGLDRQFPRILVVLGPVERREEVISRLRELVEEEKRLLVDLDN